MNSFSINAYEHQTMLDYYKQWLVRDLYSNLSLENLDDPTFLQKLSIIQADGIRRDIEAHAAITHSSIQGASTKVGRKIQMTANLITSSLDEGFSLMNQRIIEVNNTLNSIDKGIGTINSNIIEGNRLRVQTNTEIQSLNKNMVIALSAINSNISQATNILKYQLQQVSNVLQAILDELKIPESQRERRYHIEEGIKYFNMGMKSGDCLYFDDALDEFTTATSIERKDFFSWFYLGMIYLYSKNHIDIEKSISAFDRYFHYAAALPKRHDLYDDALLMKAECYYLEQDMANAFKTIENILSKDTRAVLRGIKYLSATGVSDKQIQAVSLLKSLMKQNPYIVMQVLEDYDILCNDYVLFFLKEYNDRTKKEIAELIYLYDKEMEPLKRYPISYYDGLNNEIDEMKSQVHKKIKGVGVVDAIALKEKLYAKNILDKIKKTKEEIQKKAEEDAAQKRRVTEEKAAKEKKFRDREYLLTHGFVDLGLPSGTIWKNENEKGFFYYDKAVCAFPNMLPTEWQFRELRDKCQWQWYWSLFQCGYKIVGPNGASIFLPSEGVICDSGELLFKRKNGYYLSSTIGFDEDYSGERVRCLIFSSSNIDISFSNYNFHTYSVRLAFL